METQKHQERERGNELKEDKASTPPSPPPPSSASSPSHDFSFTISLNSLAPNTALKCNKATPALVVDLAPADDIFFHGHLLPLHLLSHPPIPPRSSTDITIENFSLPIEHIDSYQSLKYDADDDRHHNHLDTNGNGINNKGITKSRTFSSFFGLGKLRKGNDYSAEKEEDKKKKRKGFEMSRFLKKYARMVETLFFFKGEKEKRDLRRRPYSFSGYSNRRERDGWKRKKGQFSAPASMWTSPTNSGLLSATPTTFSSSDNSTMEELQSAIQAAIAHCKNSIALKEERCKC